MLKFFEESTDLNSTLSKENFNCYEVSIKEFNRFKLISSSYGSSNPICCILEKSNDEDEQVGLSAKSKKRKIISESFPEDAQQSLVLKLRLPSKRNLDLVNS